MDVVIDTSALVAVIVGEPERNRIIELTTGCSLIGGAYFQRQSVDAGDHDGLPLAQW
jgi:hypothetical protein